MEALQLQPQTDIASDRSGSMTFIGEWQVAMAILPGFAVVETATEYTFAAFTPAATLSAAPATQTIAINGGDWDALATTLISGNLYAATSANIRARPAGMAELTIRFVSPKDLKREIERETDIQDDDPPTGGERSYSFGVSEIPHSILETETIEVQNIIGAWLTGPTVLKTRFLYLNAETGQNALLSDPEKIIAQKIINGQDTEYEYRPTVTLTISKAAADPTDLPNVGAAATPPANVNIRLGADSYTWRVISSGTAESPDGTWSGSVTWEGTKV